MTDKTDSKEREALVAYLKDCDAHDIVPDVGGAWHAAFQAGRASLAASAGSEPVAVVGSNFALYWAGSGPIAPIVEKHGIKVGSPLYTHPSPPEGMVMVPKVPTMAMRVAAKTADMDHTNLSDWMVSDWPEFNRIWDAMLKAAPPTTSAGSGKGE